MYDYGLLFFGVVGAIGAGIALLIAPLSQVPPACRGESPAHLLT